MARLRARPAPPLDDVELDLIVSLRPGYQHSAERLEELEAAWEVYGEQIVAEHGRDCAGWRMFEQAPHTSPT